MNAKSWRARAHACAAAGAMIAMLVGCGSGGDAAPAEGGPAAPPTPAPAPTPPAISVQPSAQGAPDGGSVTFSVTASGDDLRYQWQRNGSDIAGATGASYTVTVAAGDDGARFGVVVSNSGGSVTSEVVTLTVSRAAPSTAPRLATGGRLNLTFSAARSSTGTLWLWGSNTRSQIGDGLSANRALPFPWSLPAPIAAMSLGNESTLAVDGTGVAFWAGAGSNGQDGTSTSIGTPLNSPTRVSVQSNVRTVAIGNGFTVAALHDGTVWGWGALPTGVSSASAVRIDGLSEVGQICVAEESILALKADGTVWFTGTDRGGAMPGQGRSITSTVAPAIQIPALSGVDQIACGLGQPTAYGLARRSDGTVFSWGDAAGLGYAIPSQFVEFHPRQVDGLSEVTWIAASNTGMSSAFAVTADGRVRSWGYDRVGSLALGAMSSSTRVVTPTVSTLISEVVEVATSGEHTLFVKRDGTVWGVGSNANAQLGNTTQAAVGSSVIPVQVTGINLN